MSHRGLLLLVGRLAVGATEIQGQSISPSGEVKVDEVKVVWSEVGPVALLAVRESVPPSLCIRRGRGQFRGD